MSRLARSFLLSVVSLIALTWSKGLTAEDVVCPEDVTKQGAILGKVLRSPNPWPAVNRDEFRFAFKTHSPKSLFVFGYKAEELEQVGPRARACQGAGGLFQVDAGTGPDWDRLTSEVPFEVFWPGPSIPIVEKTGKHLTVIQVPFPDVNSLGIIPRLAGFEASAQLHERFHIAQTSFPVKWTGKGENFLKCANVPGWIEALREEFSDWSTLEKDLGAVSLPEIAEIGARIVNRRAASTTDRKLAKCWTQIAHEERDEGTAQYFENESLRLAGMDPPFDRFPSEPPLSEAYLTPATLKSLTSVYITGSRICRVLDRLNPTKEWQKDVMEGMAPIHVLQKHLKN